MTTQHYIFLENVRFYSYHGVAPQETAIGNEFIINLRLKTDFGKATETDEVEDTVSYADIYATLRDGTAFKTAGTCMRTNRKKALPGLSENQGDRNQTGEKKPAHGSRHRLCRSRDALHARLNRH